MHDFLKFYDSIKERFPWSIEIYNSSVMDWCITIGYQPTHTLHGEKIVHVQDCDMELVFAKAQVLLKEYLSENHGGY